MDEAKLKRLIRLVEESDIEELEIDRPFGRIRITKKRAEEKPPLTAIREPVVAAAPAPAVLAPTPVEPAVAHPTENSKPAALTIVAPMVGTFYTAPAPGAKPYVSVGDLVKVGQVVCIVEAMKLMNEVQSEVTGKIVKACVESGQAVEYGQELFHVSPS